ncbi:nitrous oxide reductase family maturation protein NosD [Bacillus tianshenii]|nr:nitrous oxide reductase family maturation protein NosD [Bacillus tianshenii]
MTHTYKLILPILFVVISWCMPAPVEGEEVSVTPEKGALQRAIASAKEGDELVLTPGVYNEKIKINKSLKIKGKQGVVIDGGGEGNVIVIKAPNVRLENIEIQNSGSLKQEAGIRIEGDRAQIISNSLQRVHYGIYIAKADAVQIIDNQIIGDDTHFSKRGNGIHLFHATHTTIAENNISHVQDGIYFDFAKNTAVTKNEITNARYAVHLMFSEKAAVSENKLSNNINGLMVMSTKYVDIFHNDILKNLHFRGYGVLLYETDDVTLQDNRIISNSTGLALQYSEGSLVRSNVIAGNHVGIELTGENVDTSLMKNNVIGNVIQLQEKAIKEDVRIESSGNYWDDYRGGDLNGDGFGEIPYQASEALTDRNPYFQFYFESPALMLQQRISRMLPVREESSLIEEKPSVSPNDLYKTTPEAVPGSFPFEVFIVGVISTLGSLGIFYSGRRKQRV